MSGLTVLIGSWVFLGLILIVLFVLVYWLVSLIQKQNLQMQNLIHLGIQERAELLEMADRNQKELLAFGLKDRAELLNRLMTKTWEQFIQVQSATQPETEAQRFDDSIAPEERWDYDPRFAQDAGIGEVIVELDNGAVNA